MSVYRELFVEVAEALLAGAVAQAERPKVTTYVEPMPWHLLLDGPEWVTLITERLPAERVTRFIAKCSRCRRRPWYFDQNEHDLLLIERPGAAIDFLAAKINSLAAPHRNCEPRKAVP